MANKLSHHAMCLSLSCNSHFSIFNLVECDKKHSWHGHVRFLCGAGFLTFLFFLMQHLLNGIDFILSCSRSRSGPHSRWCRCLCEARGSEDATSSCVMSPWNTEYSGRLMGSSLNTLVCTMYTSDSDHWVGNITERSGLRRGDEISFHHSWILSGIQVCPSRTPVRKRNETGSGGQVVNVLARLLVSGPLVFRHVHGDFGCLNICRNNNTTYILADRDFA